jgi:hypothetical protein
VSDDDVPGGTILMALVGTDVNAPVALLHGPAEGDYVAGLIGAEVLGQVLGDTWQAIFDEDARGKDLPPNRVASIVAQAGGWVPPGDPPPFAALRGQVVFTGVINDGDEATDVPDRLLAFVRDLDIAIAPPEDAPHPDAW